MPYTPNPGENKLKEKCNFAWNRSIRYGETITKTKEWIEEIENKLWNKPISFQKSNSRIWTFPCHTLTIFNEKGIIIRIF